MAVFAIGEFIRKTRKQLGITQEELAEPYMDRSHISKIERGVVTPDYGTLKVLLERLGVTEQHLGDFFISDEEARIQECFSLLDGLIVRGEFQAAKSQLEELKSIPSVEQKGFYRQKLLLSEGIIILQTGENLDAAYARLQEAMRISVLNFDESRIEDYLLTKNDVLVINNIVVYHTLMNNREKSVEILYRLKKNFDTRFVDVQSKGAMYTLLLANLTYLLEELERYQEAVELCDLGKKVCLGLGKAEMLPSFVAIKANCLYELGNEELAQQMFKQAYYGFELQERFAERNTIKHYVKKIGLDIAL
ncbi:MAG: helix-turn-helix transcriptional regulator [Turicibacter sp.]|nr:helix-turn-helix transcriptional regulator [Turicibacter sp.]